MRCRFNLTKILLSVYLLPAMHGAFGAPQVCNNIGVNLAGVSYYGSEAPFVDLMKMSKGWERPWGTKEQDAKLALNAQGYPFSISPSLSLVNIVHDDRWSRPKDENTYQLSWDGRGRIVPSSNAAKIMRSEANQLIFKMIRNERIWVDLKETDAADPVRNVRVVPLTASGRPAEGVFRVRFMNNLANMRLLRFMQWGNTNNSRLKEWGDRRLPEYSTQATGGKGVAYEHMIELANELGSDVWVNVPHEASDHYVWEMAKLFHTKLNPRQTLYVEYSNEIWNSMFSQYKYLHEQAKRNGRQYYEAYVDRALQVFDIWRHEFGRQNQLKVVLAGQFVNPWLTGKMLEYKDAGKRIDGFAIGYYVGHEIGAGENFHKLMNAAPEDLINRLKTQSIPQARKMLNEQAAALTKYNLPLLAYEAGQHLAATGSSPDGKPMVEIQQVTDLLIATNRHPAMSDIYKLLLDDWQKIGGGPIAFFGSTAEPGKWGSWGLRENEAQSIADAPKLKGIYQYCGWAIH